MRFLGIRSLRWRLVAVMCAAYIIVAIVSTAAGYSTQRTSLLRQEEGTARSSAAIAAAGAVPAFNSPTGLNRVALTNFLKSVQQAQGVSYADVLGPDRCVVVSTRPSTDHGCRPNQEITGAASEIMPNGDIMGSAPIIATGQNTVLGTATVVLSSAAMQQDLHDTLVLEILVRALGLLIFVLLSLLIARYILGPVTNLVRAATALRRGRMNTRLRATGQTELTAVAEAFNEMAAALETRIEHLSFLAHAGATFPSTLREGGDGRPLLAEFCQSIGACGAGLLGPEGPVLWWSEDGDGGCFVTAARAAQDTTTPRVSHTEEHSVMTVPVVGQWVFVTVRNGGSPFTDEEQQVLTNFAYQVGIAVDNVRLFEAQQDALQVKDQFLSIVSHELRTPLTTVKGYAQMLRRKLESDPDGQRFAGSIDAQVTRLSRLVDDLLDVTRFARGQFELTPRDMDLRPVLEDTVHRFAMIAPNHSVRLETDGQSLEGYWDRDRLEQVLNNLIGNAIKYSPSGGDVTVRAHREDGDVVVSVRDQGVGIAPEDQEHLFERFFRTGSAQNVKGMGLGLYVTERVVEAHGGKVGVESVPGEGSEFFFTLPLKKATSAATA
jgi:signal transduction histidine kinase